LIEEDSYINNVSDEIDELREEHQFFFDASLDLNMNHVYGDVDLNGNPVGLIGTFSTGEVSIGSLIVILKCEVQKNATGVSDGEIDNSGGETAIEIAFPITIQ
ncbi:MAG: type 1 periplasmic binding fold superfamily protein, partial [Bacteroidota bacterium]